MEHCTLDVEVSKFVNALRSVFARCTHKVWVKCHVRENAWWNDELNALRKRASKCYKAWKTLGNDEQHQRYLLACKEYKQALLEAKASSWKEFCSGANTPKSLANISKVLQ